MIMLCAQMNTVLNINYISIKINEKILNSSLLTSRPHPFMNVHKTWMKSAVLALKLTG